MENKQDILHGSIRAASYNIVYQICCRILTFVINAFTLHYISHDVLGVINVRLTLYYSTVLFVSREACRRASLSKTKEQSWTHVVNLVWLIVPSSVIFATIFGFIWIYAFVQPDESVTTQYTEGVIFIGLSIVVETVNAPAHLIAHAFFFIKLQVALSTLYILLKSMILCIAVVWHPHMAVWAFGVGHIVAASAYTMCYYAYFWYYMKQKQHIIEKNKKMDEKVTLDEEFPFFSLSDFMPKKLPGQPWLNSELSTLGWSFFKQGLLKQVLTEGERYLMTVFNLLTFPQQGIYDVVANLSSLVVRFVFLPVEDSCYYYFAQLVRRDRPLIQQDQVQVAQVSKVLKTLLTFMMLTGMVFVVFGNSYSHLLLRLYGGTALCEGEGPKLLRAQCLYVLFLAINGVTEAYVFACMNKQQINSHNNMLVVVSALFLLCSWILIQFLGSVGFILANCCNMLARIIHSMVFIHYHYEGTTYRPVNGLKPSVAISVAFLIASLATSTSEMYLYPWCIICHVILGAFCLLMILGAIATTEKEMTSYVLERFFKKPTFL